MLKSADHRERLQVQSPEAAYRSRVQERYTGKGMTSWFLWPLCSGQLPLTENAIRCVWASASCYRRWVMFCVMYGAGALSEG